MQLRKIVSLAALAAVILAVPTAASANYRVGLSEQNPALFSQPAWQSLKLKRVRYIVAWDYYKDPGQVAEANGFLNAAHAAGQDVLVAFSARRGCYVNGHYSKSSACKAPSTSAYKSAVTRFHKEFPYVKTFSPWNEENHVSQPTHSSPKRAVQYYDTLRRACKGCTVMAADVLDQSNVTSWLRSFLHYSHGRGTIWGLHNYKDVNRKQSKGLTSVLKTVPGQLWLTETGGIVTFLPAFKTSLSRSASATKYMFQLADRYDSKRSGNRSKLTRLYVYRWFGEPKGARFDAGLVNADGSPRSALAQFEKYAKHRLK
jgi:Glycosyl hydrolase catalytic core